MRAKWLVAVACGLPVLFFLVFLLTALSAPKSTDTSSPGNTKYTLDLEKDPEDWLQRRQRENGADFSYVIPFKIRENDKDKTIVTEVPKEKIIVREAGKRIRELDLFQPKADNLTIALAMDVSGSMARGTGESGKTKIAEARDAAYSFLDQLSNKADVGLILFNHEVMESEVLPPLGQTGTTEQIAHRGQVMQHVQKTPPQGGTAYVDATKRALEMLRTVKTGRRAIVVLTDGRDVDSTSSQEDVINLAKDEGIPVYTVGIGVPASNLPVSTILVLDQSTSMSRYAKSGDAKTKMGALKDAASRFVDLMPPHAQASLLPFSHRDPFKTTTPLTADQKLLKHQINGLVANGGTFLFSATESGIEELAKADTGNRYLVVLTDGQDMTRINGMTLASYRTQRIDRIVQQAKRERIKIYTLGFGSNDRNLPEQQRVDDSVLKRMAEGTGGEYFPARDQQELYQVFERLSALLHDDGIDEASLREMAKATGGAYFPAREASKLQKQFKLIADELQSTYVAKFPSRYQRADGLKDKIEIYVIDHQGKRISNVGAGDVTRRGLVVPEISHVTYLVILALLLVLLGIPGGLRRLYRSYGGA